MLILQIRHVGLLFSLLMVACVPLAEHGPISAKVLRELDSRPPLTRDEFLTHVYRRSVAPAPFFTQPFQLQNGVPIIRVGVNGRANVPMMLDSGASRSLLHAKVAADSGVRVLKSTDVTVAMHGVVGQEEARVGMIMPLQLGPWRLEGHPCLIRLHENRFLHGEGAEAFPDSLLGIDLALKHCSYLTINYLAGQVTWAFDRRFQPQAGERVSHAPFKIVRGVPMITLKSKGIAWDAVVDTGSFNGIEINEKVATQLGLADQGRVIEGLFLMGVGGTITSDAARLRVVTLPELALLGGRYQRSDVDISPGPPRVGSFFLKQYRVTFDFQRRWIWLEW